MIYTGSISVKPSCLIPADSTENVFHFTSGSLSPNSGRLDTITTRASYDSTVSTSTASSSKRRHPSKTPASSRPHSKKQSTADGKSNGVFNLPSKIKANVQVPQKNSIKAIRLGPENHFNPQACNRNLLRGQPILSNQLNAN
ncbi:hypothetical protein FGIG_03594 [Fasciola gigantica]|uniref:Uncharacterized protein n=1 Tax=Fasciola gigantica TaxID=46835 RepID=A0A504YR46_FASGI|nr:hypothetical protein FGIG_03594 [Fasciola gigantica]